eukprot:10287-Rhodomonas_salina.1
MNINSTILLPLCRTENRASQVQVRAGHGLRGPGPSPGRVRVESGSHCERLGLGPDYSQPESLSLSDWHVVH